MGFLACYVCQSVSMHTMGPFVDFSGLKMDVHYGAFPGRITFSRELFLSLWSTTDSVVNIPLELCRSDAKSTQWKNGRRGGTRQRLKNTGFKGCLFSLQSCSLTCSLLATSWTSWRLGPQSNMKRTRVLTFTETWTVTRICH